MNEDILFKYIKGETTAEENLQVAEWVEIDPEKHQEKLNTVRFIYQFSVLYGPEVDHKIASETKSKPWIISWRKLGNYTLRLAAAIMLLMAGGYITKHKIYNKITEQMTVFQVPNGQRIEITLSDGSTVWLNSGARLEYPVVFKENIRKVKLSGEALFDVKHNSKWPFKIETYASDISVLGTKFNVIADETYHRFSTILLQGKVKISNRLDPNQQEIIMKPNDIVNLSNGRLFLETMKDPEALCWTKGLVNINGLSFKELMSKFEQVFDVKIIISRRVLPDIGRISGKIRVNDGIENALHILQYAVDFTYEKDAETNVVTIH